MQKVHQSNSIVLLPISYNLYSDYYFVILLKKSVLSCYTSVGKMAVLVVTTISTIFIISLDGKVLAQDNNVVTQPGYLLTVNVLSHPFGTSTIGISITTEDGYTDQANIPTAGNPSWTFNIPPNQGSSVQVCVNSGALSEENCHIYKTTGSAMSVSLPAVSGSSGSSNNSPSDNNDNNKGHHDSSTTNNDSNEKSHSNHHNSSTDNSNDNGGGRSQHGKDGQREFGSNSGFNENQGSSFNGIRNAGSDTHQGNRHQGLGGSGNDSLGSNSHHNGDSSNTINNPGVPKVQFIGPIQ
jgi:hypothetical protein